MFIMMARMGVLMLVALAAWGPASSAAASAGLAGPDSLAIRSLASPVLQLFT